MDVNQVLEATLSPGKVNTLLNALRGHNSHAESLQTPQLVRMRNNSSHRPPKPTLLVHMLLSRVYGT